MKWSSHTEIARCIAEALELPEGLRELMAEASIDPDRNPIHVTRSTRDGTESRRVRHHDPGASELMKLLWKARRARLEGRDEDAVWALGRALHYIQDAHVSTGPFMLWHDRREAEIGRLQVDPDLAMLGVSSAIPSPHFVTACLRSVGPIRDSRQALDRATMFSASIAAATLEDPSPSPSLVARWRREGRRHNYIVLPLAVAAPLALASLSFALGAPQASVIGIPVFVAALGLDSSFYFDREEAKWFGMTV